MKKIHRLLKVMGTGLFVALTGLALFTRIPKSEGVGSMPIPSSFLSSNISAAKPEISEVIPSQTALPQEMELDNSLEEQEKDEGDVAFSLLIHGREIAVWDNVDEKILGKGPGWLPSSAYPGEVGSCIVYGHRNRTHLRILERIKEGDKIKVILRDNRELTYIVKKIALVKSDSDLQFEAIEGASLILTTCYPFRYSGSAPQKYVVTAMKENYD